MSVDNSQIQSDAAAASLITSLGFTALVTLLFCFVRPYNTAVYAPRLRHADEKHAPPQLSRSPWAWIIPVAKTKEQELVQKVGMDAVVFLRFTRMCRNMFLVLTIVGCAILIPINYIGGKKFFRQWNDVKGLMKLTPQYMFGEVYWAFVACAYAFDAIVCFFLWWNYRAVLRLRRQYFESPEYQSSLHSRTLMVNDIPRELRTDDGVLQIVDALRKTLDSPRGVISRNMKELPDLIEEHEEAVRALESVLAKYLKKPDKLPAVRPMCKPLKQDKSCNSTEKVDAIDYLTGRIQDLEARIKEVRLSVDNRNAMQYGFASYESISDAHSVAYAGRKKKPQGAIVKLAPRPSDIIWKNMSMTKAARKSNRLMNNIWITLLTMVWIVPNILIAVFLTNLANLGKVWPTFQTELERHSKFWAVVQGVAAPLITTLFYYFLPAVFRKLSMLAGDTTKTSRDRHVTNKLYAFFVLNNLILFSAFGTLWQFGSDIIVAQREQKDAWDALKETQFFSHIMNSLANLSPFWLSWLLQRNLGAAIDLSQLTNLFKRTFARKFLSPTPRQLIEWTAPPPFDYTSYYNYFLFYTTVALCFATLQPLVLPVTAVYFILDSWLKKYLILYVFVTKTESGGRFWRILFNRTLFALLLSNVVIALLVRANGKSWIMLAVMGGLPFLLLGFKVYCKHAFDEQMAYYTRGKPNDPESAVSDDKVSQKSDRVSVRFGHPALYQPLLIPMVHSNAQHLLSEIYRGRLDNDDAASVAGYSDMYSYGLSSMSNGKPGKRATKTGPFEFVNESELDFENYKARPDFRAEHGGEGSLYGRSDDTSRPGTARTLTNGSIGSSSDADAQFGQRKVGFHDRTRSTSRDSERTLRDPPSRDFSPVRPGLERYATGSQENLRAAAAPMGVVTEEDEVQAPPHPVAGGIERKPIGGTGTATFDSILGKK